MKEKWGPVVRDGEMRFRRLPKEQEEHLVDDKGGNSLGFERNSGTVIERDGNGNETMRLSMRALQIFKKRAQGKSIEQISNELGISRNTVKRTSYLWLTRGHKEAGLTRLAVKAARWGLLEPGVIEDLRSRVRNKKIRARLGGSK